MFVFKCLTLAFLSLWSVTIWTSYFDARQIVTEYQNNNLSEEFWQWEAQGRLNLIDLILDDPLITQARENREFLSPVELANYLIKVQKKAYGLPRDFQAGRLVFTPLRGDANGFYRPSEQIIFINSLMQWQDLPFERLIEVVLHENMHHILTHKIAYINQDANLYADFLILHRTAKQAETATDNHQNYSLLQETVTWSAQRAARYAGILSSVELSAWDMSTRMQEVRVLSKTLYN